MAKNGYGAARVITTVSMEKVGKVDGLLGNGVLDQGLFSSTVVEFLVCPIAGMPLG
jgi:hypothetical protein